MGLIEWDTTSPRTHKPKFVNKSLPEELSLDTGTVPIDWKTLRVAAIFMMEKSSKPATTGLFPLHAFCCRIQEHSITSNVLKHPDNHRNLTDYQHSFRARRSCETQLFTLTEELISGLDKKQQHDLIILDISKAFDRVPHQRLLKKLDHYCVEGSTHSWIKAFLTDRTQQVFWWKAPHLTVSKLSAECHKEQS